ncbi:MAG TPA: cell wall hydrolase [Allosphingosinicella sp.]|nr:cell wall hydrolase [Allosphingosinicella sp.]
MRIGLSLAFLAAACFASPALAQTELTAASLGLEGLADPAPATQPPVETAAEVEVVGRSLPALVAVHAASATSDAETECLARAVYFESRGEPLSGQLAVAEVIINRARSGRFAPTLCAVVRQPSQFSFVRRGYIPQPPTTSRDWHTAVAIARIATDRLAEGGAPQALFFHARRINPGWRLTRVATVGNHVFYR